jgi:HlyD family secretion protein
MILAILVSAGASGCGSSELEDSATGAGPQGKMPPTLVRVATIEKRRLQPQIMVVGSVTPRYQSVVASGADGVVEQFLVEEGQFVSQGEALASLRMVTTDLGIKEATAVLRERRETLAELEAGSRPEEIAEAKAKMLSAKASQSNAKTKQERAQQLFQRNATNREELEDATERWEAAEQMFLAAKAVFERIMEGPRKEQVEQARARYEAQHEQVAFLEAEKEKRITKAPFDGYVVRNMTFVGQWLSKGDPIVQLVMLDEVDVVVNVDQWQLGHIRPGDTADVRVERSQQQKWTGKVVAIVPRSDWASGSRAFPVEIRLKNRFDDVDGEPQPVLKVGMIAEVTFRGAAVDALLAPKDALVRTSRGTMLYLYRPDENNPQSGTVQQLFVTPGVNDGTSVQLIAEDLSSGMQVVTEGAERLRPFQTVQVAAELAVGTNDAPGEPALGQEGAHPVRATGHDRATNNRSLKPSEVTSARTSNDVTE